LPRTKAPLEPLAILLVRRGPVPSRALSRLQADSRFELFTTDGLTSEWITLAKRVAGIIVATESDPLSALGYVITAGVSGPIVVAMSTRYKSDCRDLMSAGASACITMPVTKSELDRLIPLLRGRAVPARIDTTLRLLLDPISREVRFHDRRIHLSQREFALLHCLSLHGGRPVSAEEMLNYVWGDAESAERSRKILDVYVFQVRKKLNQIGLKGAISTVRRFGYALVQVAEDGRR
jgi:DNA-binding response OmpR family regulator